MYQILCFGDSNTWGYIPETKTRYPWGKRWTSILQNRLAEEEVHIIEEGLVGRTTVFEDAHRPYRNGSNVLPLTLETNEGIDAVVLMLGTNDCKSAYHTTAQSIGKGIEVLLGQIRKSQPSAKIILVSPIHLGEDVWKEEFDPEFNQDSVRVSKELKEVYQKIARKWGTYFVAASDYVRPSEADMEHLSEKSHKILANVLYGTIKKVLQEDFGKREITA